ncbi:MAG: hypothetical protein ACREVR_21000 [Burkholderiales bacterium]
MRHGDATLIPSPPTSFSPSGPQHWSLAVGARRLASRARTLIASDHLALRLAASAGFVGALALAVWWAVGVFAAL